MDVVTSTETRTDESVELEERIDPVWTSSRTARQIYALGEVEKDIGKLLALAASSISLLALPQSDPPESSLPHGEERSEQFVLEANEYFERLDQIHINMRSTLAHIRQSRIAPSAITAPPPNFVPQPAGVGTPALDRDGAVDASNGDTGTGGQADASSPKRGLQEERVNRDAWRGVLDALTRLKEARERERAAKAGLDE